MRISTVVEHSMASGLWCSSALQHYSWLGPHFMTHVYLPLQSLIGESYLAHLSISLGGHHYNHR